MFFLSSPPHPPPQPQYFNNPFAFSHAPSTPSPLRTSYNANVVKRSRMSDQQHHKTPAHTLSSPLRKSSTPWPSDDSENIFSPPNLNAPADTPNTTSSFATPSTSAFTFTPPAPSAASGPSFAFATRARASSPANQLSSRAAATKAQNKARFLDRIRTKRDEGLGRDEKVLRADYLGERRAWEAEMARRAVAEEEPEDTGSDGGEGAVGMDVQEEEQSPTEEKEIEALVALMEREDEEQAWVDGDGDSQEWDEVFMEVLSQQEPHLPVQQRAQDPGDDAGRDGMDVEMS